MFARIFLGISLAIIAILVTAGASVHAQARWDGGRYVAIVLLDEGGSPLIATGACFLLWSHEGLASPLRVCDNLDRDQVPVRNLGSAEGGAVVPTGMSDLNPTPGVIWVDVSSIGPNVLVTESTPPQGFNAAIACVTAFAPCSQEGANIQVGAAATFTYGKGNSAVVPTVEPQPTASWECQIIEQYPNNDQAALLIRELLASGEANSGAWGTDILEAILIDTWNQWTLSIANGENPGDVTFAEYLSQRLGC